MTLGLWLLCGVGVVLCYVALFTMMKMAGDQDRLARRAEKKISPWSDVTVTQYGS